MAWVTPTTWIANQQVTKGQFNAWNANLASVGDHGAWTTWSPSLVFGFETTSVTRSGMKLKVGTLAVAAWSVVADSTCDPELVNNLRLRLPWTSYSTLQAIGWAYAYLPVVDNTYTLAAVSVLSTAADFFVTADSDQYGGSKWYQVYESTRCCPAELDHTGVQLGGVLIYRTNA